MGKVKTFFAACGIASILGFAAQSAVADEEKRILVGYVENIHIPTVDLKLKAKLDTGAYTSSIHATIIEVRSPDEDEEEKSDDAESSDEEKSSDEAKDSQGDAQAENTESDAKDADPLHENPESDKKDRKKRKKKSSKHETIIFKLEIDDKKDDKSDTRQLKYPVERWVDIKTKDGGAIRRPVVRMHFCIAGVLVEEEVNLANRENFNYDVLIGRNMLIKGGFVVDSSKAFTANPNCFKTQEISADASDDEE